jgi:general L-amino acid transport system permease protein
MKPVLNPYRQPLPPPIRSAGIVGWIRENLFSGWINTVITLILLWVVFQILTFVINWAFIDAVWIGGSAESCSDQDGACWAFVTDRWRLFVYGLYPREILWRVNTVYLLAIILITTFVFSFGKYTKRFRISTIIVFPVATIIFLFGGIFGMRPVSTESLGGLLLTLVVASTGILGAMPLGLLLALGRTSELTVIRWICIVFIEFWRGIPLIVAIVLFVALLPIFIPDGGKIDVIIRIFIAFAAFNSAYMAEVFRGGLQSIPAGQFEAANSIGLSYWQMMIYIILPQAIKNAVPALVNTCISIFKETTLIMLVGFSDFLGIIHMSLEDPKWLGPPQIFASAYIFAALVFFVFTFGMSRYSVRLENRRNIDI